MSMPGGLDRLPDGPVWRMFAAARQHDLDAMCVEFANDYANITPNHPHRSFTGSAQVRANWSALFAGIPDLTLEVQDAATAPNGKVWVEWTSAGMRRDGVPVQQAGIAIFSLREGQLSAARFYFEPVEYDSGDVNAAIGAITGSDSGGARP